MVTVHSLNLGILHALRCARSRSQGSLLPSLRFGVTLSSLRVRYAPLRRDREPQSSTALRILFKPTSERV